MDENKHPHLRLVKTQKQAAPPPEPETRRYVYEPAQKYRSGLNKNDVVLITIGSVLIGTLLGVIVVALWGGITLL